MTPTFDNGIVRLFAGDVRDVLRDLPAASVQTCVTSPPYWGLRDYGLPALVWGGDEDCEHEWGELVVGKSQSGSLNGSTLGGAPPGEERRPEWSSAFCACGAWRGCLGLEPTIDLYVAHMVEVFREVRRVLRDDGTVWLNLGDSYASTGRSPQNASPKGTDGQSKEAPGRDVLWGNDRHGNFSWTLPGGLKPKDLCGIPWRVAFALQADGWWLRSDIVWSKPNPMPESVTDRPTGAHEYVFLLSKKATYYYDAEAIRETHQGIERANFDGVRGELPKAVIPGQSLQHDRAGNHPAGRNKRTVWEIATEPMGWEWCQGCGMVYSTAEYRRLTSGAARRCTTPLDDAGEEKCGGTRWEAQESGALVCTACEVEYSKSAVEKMPRAAECRRCKRDDAWGSHFATFPQKLVEPCILAGTPAKGSCSECGAPWERVVERDVRELRREPAHQPGNTPSKVDSTGWTDGNPRTTGWRPTCDHDAEPEPGVVLDPFVGSGTTAFVAQRLGRRAIAIDLSADYLALAEKRLRGQTLPMALT